MSDLLLTVGHNIFLTREQRYALIENKYLEVIGVSVPCWFNQGLSSEPANEVFCKYKINVSEVEPFIRYKENGYTINLLNGGKTGVNSLRDYKDSGVETLGFNYPGRLKNNNRYIKVMHILEIKDMEELTTTMS